MDDRGYWLLLMVMLDLSTLTYLSCFLSSLDRGATYSAAQGCGHHESVSMFAHFWAALYTRDYFLLYCATECHQLEVLISCVTSPGFRLPPGCVGKSGDISLLGGCCLVLQCQTWLSTRCGVYYWIEGLQRHNHKDVHLLQSAVLGTSYWPL